VKLGIINISQEFVADFSNLKKKKLLNAVIAEKCSKDDVENRNERTLSVVRDSSRLRRHSE